MFGRRKYIADMEFKRIFSFLLMLGMLLTMLPTAYAAEEFPDGNVPTEEVQSTETQPVESELTEGQDEYTVTPRAAADKYAYFALSVLYGGAKTVRENGVVTAIA